MSRETILLRLDEPLLVMGMGKGFARREERRAEHGSLGAQRPREVFARHQCAAGSSACNAPRGCNERC